MVIGLPGLFAACVHPGRFGLEHCTGTISANNTINNLWCFDVIFYGGGCPT